VPRSLREYSTNGISRALLGITSVGMATIGVPLVRGAAAETREEKQLAGALTVQEAADLIRGSCTQTLSAVRNTGRLLYRGEAAESLATTAPTILAPAFDLLSNRTYSPLAADYFRCLDSYMAGVGAGGEPRFPVTPRNGHLATSDVVAASEWGVPVSVWPLDAGLHFAWLLNDVNWWDNDWGLPRGKRGPLFWRSGALLETFVQKEVRYDRSMESALAKGGELLFGNCACRDGAGTCAACAGTRAAAGPGVGVGAGAYVAVPLRLEPQLLRLLDVQPFSSSARVSLAPSIVVDGDPVKRKYTLGITGW